MLFNSNLDGKFAGQMDGLCINPIFFFYVHIFNFHTNKWLRKIMQVPDQPAEGALRQIMTPPRSPSHPLLPLNPSICFLAPKQRNGDHPLLEAVSQKSSAERPQSPGSGRTLTSTIWRIRAHFRQQQSVFNTLPDCTESLLDFSTED